MAQIPPCVNLNREEQFMQGYIELCPVFDWERLVIRRIYRGTLAETVLKRFLIRRSKPLKLIKQLFKLVRRHIRERWHNSNITNLNDLD